MTEKCREATVAAIAVLGKNHLPETVWTTRKHWSMPIKRVVVQAFRDSGMSLNEIGAEVGQDHTSVMNHLRQANKDEIKAAKAVQACLQRKMVAANVAMVTPTDLLDCVASAVASVLPPPMRKSVRSVAFKSRKLSGEVRLVAVQDQFTAEWRWEPE
ncbi:hypothetical protein [Microcystis phage Mae-JY24]